MNYYMAPMEGITGYLYRSVYDAVFPSMAKYFTPFLSPNQTGKLGPKEYKDVALSNNQGMYAVPQILTNCAVDFIRTAKTLKSMGYEEVNLNLGCPSGTVVSKRRGSGFLAFPAELDQFLYEIFSGLDMKISVKTRLGVERPEEFEELLSIYNRYEMEELIIHPRIQKDLYRGRPRMEIFHEAVLRSKNPICYNGDIFHAEDAHRIVDSYPQLSGVMLARGLIANPGLLLWITTGQQVTKEQLKVFHDRLYDEYCRVYLSASGPKVVLFKMKELWCYMVYTFENSEKIGKKIKKAQKLGEYEEAVSTLFRECGLSPVGYCGTP